MKLSNTQAQILHLLSFVIYPSMVTPHCNVFIYATESSICLAIFLKDWVLAFCAYLTNNVSQYPFSTRFQNGISISSGRIKKILFAEDTYPQT